jgi:hypothetical protein
MPLQVYIHIYVGLLFFNGRSLSLIDQVSFTCTLGPFYCDCKSLFQNAHSIGGEREKGRERKRDYAPPVSPRGHSRHPMRFRVSLDLTPKP